MTREAGEERATPFAPENRYALNENVSLRLESFGALAYHFGTRRLTFLKTPDLVTVVQRLHEHDSVHAALRANAIPENQRSAYVSALASLARADMIVRA
jgi:putative mycofactocin binding protein MftB